MALVTWGGGRLRIETHKGSGGQITQEELSEVQGQSVEGAGSACDPPPPHLPPLASVHTRASTCSPCD